MKEEMPTRVATGDDASNSRRSTVAPGPDALDSRLRQAPPWGVAEAMWHRVHDLFAGEGDCALVLQLDGHVHSGPMQEALLAVQRRHPKLRARAVETRTGFVWLNQEPSPGQIPYSFREVEDPGRSWKSEAHRLWVQGLNLAFGPVARLTVLQNRSAASAALILVAHHGIVDGRCLMSLANDLLHYYSVIVREGRTSPIVSLPLVTIDKVQSNGRFWSRARFLARRIGQWRIRQHGRWTQLPSESLAPPPVQWTLLILTEMETLALAKACRRQSTGVYGALCAAALLSLRDVTPAPNPRFRCGSPVDLRDHVTADGLAISQEDLAMFSVALDYVYSTKADMNFWLLARRLQKDLRDFQLGGGAAQLYNLGCMLAKRSALFEKRFQRGLEQARSLGYRGTLMVSNLGVAPLRDHYSGLSVRTATMAYKNYFGGAMFNLFSMVIDNRLNVTLHAGGLPDEIWKHLREQTQHWLHQATLDSDPTAPSDG